MFTKVEKRQAARLTKELSAKIGELTVEKDFLSSARSLSVKARRATIEPRG